MSSLKPLFHGPFHGLSFSTTNSFCPMDFISNTELLVRSWRNAKTLRRTDHPRNWISMLDFSWVIYPTWKGSWENHWLKSARRGWLLVPKKGIVFWKNVLKTPRYFYTNNLLSEKTGGWKMAKKGTNFGKFRMVINPIQPKNCRKNAKVQAVWWRGSLVITDFWGLKMRGKILHLWRKVMFHIGGNSKCRISLEKRSSLAFGPLGIFIRFPTNCGSHQKDMFSWHCQEKICPRVLFWGEGAWLPLLWDREKYFPTHPTPF